MMDHCIHKGEGAASEVEDGNKGGGEEHIRSRGRMGRRSGGWEHIAFTVGSARLCHISRHDVVRAVFLENSQWFQQNEPTTAHKNSRPSLLPVSFHLI